MTEQDLLAVGKRVIVEVLEENERTDSGLLRANVQNARCRGRIISVGTLAKLDEPNLEAGKLILFYKQPSFKHKGVDIAEFNYEHVIAILGEE